MLRICVYTVIFDRTDCRLPLAADLKLYHKNTAVATWSYKHVNIIITLIMAIFSELTQ